ncbi:MAG: hypothetical protein HON47_00590 [Candidatus Diapherotrites archaeon]|jgi:hypothetical protein|uniref:Uncharacterized protein n=1 Tax=Candidatus Iainarchaeum sp. TaxID=3101447 RepID=A0A8T5GEE2_9ARCH|nr:hypothetical protein [Candidatus Diapherotrites archaeon]MBT7240925.1 hypothetical protein [Candidatus Diapherotrites archaeon]
MELKDFTGKPCRAKVAYEFLPNKKMKLKLSEIEKNIEEKFSIEVKSKILLIIRVEDKTVSLFESGKLLVRGEREEVAAKEIAKRIVELIPTD